MTPPRLTLPLLGTWILWSALTTAFAAESPKSKVDLIALIQSGKVDYHLNPTAELQEDPKTLWKVNPDGQLVVSGRGYGYVATREEFRDYHLVIEFKWGPKTLGKREKAARDNGVLVHSHGPHGAFGNTWIASIEAQIIEGGVGDLLVLSPKLPDGSILTTSISSEFGLDRDKEKIWRKGEPRQTLTAGRVNWKNRDEDWVDRVGFRGRNDVESPLGEWTRMEVIARGSQLVYLVNGVVVNEAFDCKPSEGRIALQTEGAEMWVRRYELWPLDSFKEAWNPIQASGGTDVEVRDGQAGPIAPADSRKLIELDGPYEARLVASEPLVKDPVECTWDAKGRMFVADMVDYPLGPAKPGDPWLSRIVELIDDNGDGLMDRSIVFADQLDHVQGLLPYDGGLIVTTRTQVLFLKDTNGDGRADVSRPLIAGFNPKFSQLQVSAPRWGPDGCVHFNNGLDAREIYPAEAPNSPVNVPGSNFKWDPRTGKITPTGGKGQYGGAFDDWGHHLYCSNRNPVMFTVMPFDVLSWNPAAALTQNFEDIAPSGPETRVFPVKITHTTADAHAGTNTACSGLGVYRGDLMPELKNNVFVPDPTGQLITRYKVEPKGASLVATRVGDRKEFFRSGDEWCRPVNVTTAPDGSLIVCDMYRRWIDHARFFPEEFVKTHDMRQGEHHGRIWRIVPKGSGIPVAKVPGRYHAIPETGWGDLPCETPERSAFLALNSETPLAELAEILLKHPEDPWVARKVAACASKRAGKLLASIEAAFFSSPSENRSSTVRMLASVAVSDAIAADQEHLLSLLQREPGTLSWWKPALLQGLGKLLTHRKDLASTVATLEGQVDSVLADASRPLPERLAVLPLLAQRKWDAAQPVLRKLLGASAAPEINKAALGLLKKFPADQTHDLVYELLPKAGPGLKRDLVALLTANAPSALELFQRMEKGEFPAAWVDVETRWRYQRGTGAVTELAKKLFGEASSDRGSVVTTYMEALKHPGDAAKGRAVFETICISCHRYGNLGVDVGPALSDARSKPPEALLADILDPNRMFEARWSAYQIDLNDGRSLVGLIHSETQDSLVVAIPGGARETVRRASVKEMKSLDRSLMPPGLEAAISKNQMADLLAFLAGK